MFPSFVRINRLANLIAEARRAGKPAPLPPEELLPVDGGEADAVQDATGLQVGAIGGYKVWKAAGNPDGLWGAIFAPGIYSAPAGIKAPELTLELEVAFRFAASLPGREDGADYGEDEVFAAVDAALPVYELLAVRWQGKPPALLNRADTLANWGLVYGTAVKDWKAVVRDDLQANLTIGGREAVSQKGGHVSGNPAAPLCWLANTLARHGHGIVAGQIVTTGAFGGGHPIKAGEIAVGKIEGFLPLNMRLI